MGTITRNFANLATSTGLTITGNDTAGSEIRLPEDTDNGSNYVALKAADSIASNVTFTLPNADGSANQVLQSNGSGVLSFASVSSDFVKLGTNTLGSDTSSVAFDDVFSSTYTYYKIFISDLKTSADAQIFLQLRVSGTNQSAANYAGRVNYAYNGGTGQQLNSSSNGFSIWNGWDDHDGNLDYQSTNEVTLFNPNSNARYPAIHFSGFVYVPQSSYNETFTVGGGSYLAKIAATGFRIHVTSGNIKSGTTITIYGLKV